MLYGGMEKEEYESCLPEIRKSNHGKLNVFLIMAMAFLGVMIAASLATATIRSNLYGYVGAFIAMFALWCVNMIYQNKSSWVQSLLVYLFLAAMFLLGIFLGVVSYRDEQTTAFIAFLLMLPVVFTLRPLHNIWMILIFDTLFVVLVRTFKTPRVMLVDTVNALIFGCLSIIASTFIMHMQLNNFQMKHQLMQSARIDYITQTQNRNCFEMKKNNYIKHPDQMVSCIYVDVNGLHELNNTKGHQEGDRMLKFIASALKEQFGTADTYRIGGDEFLVMLCGHGMDSLAWKCRVFLDHVEAAGYHTALGIAEGLAGETQIDALVNEAEQKMYVEKTAFYSKKENDRRRTRI